MPLKLRLTNSLPALTLLGSMLVISSSLSACRHCLTTAEPVAAILIQPASAADKQQLRQAIKQLTGRSNFLLSDQVFSRDSRLYLEKHQLRDRNGLPLIGAHNDFPDVFQLEQQGRRCQLRHLAKQQLVALTLNCRPLAP